MSRVRAGRIQRDDILEKIREIRVEPGKALRQVEVPKLVYDMAAQFTQWAPNRSRIGAQYRFKMDFIYDLLIGNCKSTHLVEAREEIEGWQTACKALLRYALNLLLAPKRPEFRRMKLSSSFYVYQVSKKLSSADKILVFMGYKRISSGSQEIQELNYEGDVDTSKVLETAADLVILHSELELVKQLVERVRGEPPLAATITLQEILRARSQIPYNETWHYLMKKGYTPQQPAAQQQLDLPAGTVMAQTQQGYQAFQRQASSGHPNQTVVSTRAEDVRRGSAPVISVSERMFPVSDPRLALTLTPPLQKRDTAEEAYSAGQGYVPANQPLQLPSQHHHLQQPKSAPSSVCAPGKPTLVDKNMAEVYHDAHEKVHAKHRHDRVEEMKTLITTSTPEQIGYANVLHQPHVSDPSVQSQPPAVQDTNTADGIYQNIGDLIVDQGSPVAVDSEHHVLSQQTVPRPYEVVHPGLVARGTDGYDQPGTVQSPSEPPEPQSEWQTAEYQKHHARLDDSIKVKQVEDLFQKFPNLVPGHKPKPSSEDHANVYHNIPGPAQDQLPSELPEPIVDSEADLQKLARRCTPTESIVSGLKNVRSVDFDNTPGPEDFLSGLQSQVTTPQTPCLVQNQHEVDAWAIPSDIHRQPHSFPSSSGSNKDKHSPGSSLGDNVALRKHSSRSGSESEDLYNSEPSGEFERTQRRGAPSKQQISTVQETDETTKSEDGVVKDGVTSASSEALKSADSPKPKPIPAKRKFNQKQQSFEVNTPTKPPVTPRKSKSGSNLLDIPSSEEAHTHSPVFSGPSSPVAPSDSTCTWQLGPPSPSENVQSKVLASQHQAKPIPRPRGQSPLSSGEPTESKDESNLDRKQQLRVESSQRPAGRPEQYFPQFNRGVPHKPDKTPPTTDVSYATAKSSASASIPHTVCNRDSTDHSRAALNQPEYPKKESPEKPKKLPSIKDDFSPTHFEMSNITSPTPDDQRQPQKVQNLDTKWVCSYCMNMVFGPVVVCDVCGANKDGSRGDSSIV